MLELNGGTKDDLEIHPNVWAGVGLVRGGAGTALVGSHEEVADRIEEYHSVGIDEFVLSGYPHLEGAYWFGEGVLPVLAKRGLWEHPHPTAVSARCRSPPSPQGRVVTARAAVVVGNPKPGRAPSPPRVHVARELAGAEPDLVVDLADLGPALLDWSDPTVTGLVEQVGAADLVVVASPTYKATYTGLLKLFLDRFPADGLRGVAVPLMLGAGPATRWPRSSPSGRCSPRSAASSRPGGSTSSTRRTTTRTPTPTGWRLARPAITAILDSTAGVIS